jgi:hypothetical protein
MVIAVRIAVQRWNFDIPASLAMTHDSEGSSSVTCNMVSKSVRGAGLTSVMSCAAAEVMSDPADKMAGCMRGASVSRLNVESGEGKVKELAVTVASICSTDDCMILARAFNSAKVSGRVLQITVSRSKNPQHV